MFKNYANTLVENRETLLSVSANNPPGNEEYNKRLAVYDQSLTTFDTNLTNYFDIYTQVVAMKDTDECVLKDIDALIIKSKTLYDQTVENYNRSINLKNSFQQYYYYNY
jgi:hypothetical protein